ncbi:MAG: hypothetical protein A3E36_00655 [Candidatus Andersenbacteria bacterium RIFCSPHIGHO2_12_FULL_45_11b]|uniref:Nucleoside 2-deoxyribosyltransferase n=1 Tax=Candidatus Andersenbacteria bacterium RIFCSPHIGHO2_12_FULL_45_11b TaxID=1797282 RepID=A0A1G1X5W3_9BACT|nr:MAG: hypothetical protein A3E36_00655 [Candidatus Andersenbacteria bacterium RIFCSPHIGHO2_12_FULL_45_11b]
MEKAYISISFKNRKKLDAEISALKEVLQKHNIRPQVFVDEYVFSPEQEKEMMEQATKDISESSLLIAELTEKAIGVGIEVGYAAALKIPVLYVKHKNAEYSKTIGGLSAKVISYENTEDLKKQLDQYLNLN